MRFDEAVSYLLSLGHETLAIKLGLRNTELLLNGLDNPERAYPKVQIAGTNGKGSACVTLASICRSAGIRTGLFTSPHLVSITERINIDGHDITEADFALYASEVRAAAERLVRDGILEALPTFFEHVTAVSLLAFRVAGVELAILETGLGGRLDSTTAAGAELVGLTAVDLDHTELLGKTLESIAMEKAAIIRPGVKAIIAPQVPEVLNQIRQQCERSGVKPGIADWKAEISGSSPTGRLIVTFETAEGRYQDVKLGLRGRHQVQTVGVALRLAETLRAQGFGIPSKAIIEGISRARHPARLELLPGKPAILLDGAHNVSGARALRSYLDEFVKTTLTIVFGVMRDKEIEQMGRILFPAADVLVLASPDNSRAAKLEVVEGLARQIVSGKQIVAAQSATQALQSAVALTPPQGVICITGSLYFIGELRDKVANKPMRNNFNGR